MAFDAGEVFYSYQDALVDPDQNDLTRSRRQIIDDFKKFIKEFFRKDRDDQLVYRQALNKDPRRLEVDLQDLREHDSKLGQLLEEAPADYLPHFERAAKEVLQEDHQLTAEGEEKTFEDVQVMLRSSVPFGPRSLRQLTSERVMKLVQIPGIITAASKPKHKATYLTIQCNKCRNTQTVACRPGMGGATVPRRCTAMDSMPGGVNESCGAGSFVVLGDRSLYVDQQTLKLQERPEDIPTGELPRTLMMVADRQLVSQVTPGSRVTMTGIYCTWRAKAMDVKSGSAATLQQPYIRVLGISEEGDGHKSDSFTNEDIAGFMEFARQKNVHDAIFSRIAPKIFGSRGSSVDHIKAAIACLLFGGARKIMPDGTTRRGDINVLMLGDPSTAKSQFLKFAHKVAPISVYTSGKGSSAAGLTAAVVQDAGSREFYLEGGAMVLADGGVVCIDEFDKMRPEDRVAIHEAMEQQTISIAKAGITTVLKSRTSVLAAANPPSGRYDDLRTTAENIDLQSTVLSRFDLIFIVRDVADRDNDEAIARFVLSTHQRAGTSTIESEEESEEERWFSRYIAYCRSHCFPRLTDEARRELRGKYVDIRDKARRTARQTDSEEPPIPITVRQLEALVRISESLARMELSGEATPEHVAKAFELFKHSTMNAMSAGLINTDVLQQQETSQVQAIEQRICDRLARGAHLSFKRLVEDLAGQGFSAPMVAQAVRVMEQRGELRKRQEGKVLVRA